MRKAADHKDPEATSVPIAAPSAKGAIDAALSISAVDGVATATATAEMPVKPRNKVLVLKDYCGRSKGASCARCAMACPKGAITLGAEGSTDAPIIDADLCSRCGICFGICDAFSSTRVTMLDLHARIRRIALTGDRVYITCKENIFPGFEPAPNVVVVPCLATFSPEFWTVLLSENIAVSIACDLTYCAECETAGEIAEVLYDHAIATAETWTGKEIGFSTEIPEKRRLLEEYTDERGFDRRAVFTKTLFDVGDIASGKRRLRNSEVLQDFYERRERNRAIASLNLSEEDIFSDFLPGGHARKMLIPKRRLLLEAIDRTPEIAERIPLYLSTTDTDLCTHAYTCVATCPTNARLVTPETGEVDVDERFCIGCGICTTVCAAGACDLAASTAAALLDAATVSENGTAGEEESR
ncbi:MAG: 4Fe-4S ferredoxin [Raoultibacter sp.]